MKQRLQKCIAQATGLSRRKAEEVIAEGRVVVNGVKITDQGTQASLELDKIEVDGKLLGAPIAQIYLMLYKPRRLMTTRADPEGRPTVMSLLPENLQTLFPVGRLDFESEGLLLMTNDGAWANELMHPRYEVEKEYEVTTKITLNAREIQELVTGINLDDGPGQFLSVRLVKGNTYSIIVGEGRNRFIRRMITAIDHEVTKLKRVRIGRLLLGEMKAGESRALSADEIALLSHLKKAGQ